MTPRRTLLFAILTAAVILSSIWVAQRRPPAPSVQGAPRAETPSERPDRLRTRPESADAAAREIVCPAREYLVVGEGDRKPIAGARLVLREDGRRGDLAEAVTDAAGRARFENVKASYLVVQATAPGYQPSLDWFQGETQSETTQITLWPGVRAFGRVVDDATGQPVAGARVLSVSLDHGRMSSPLPTPDIEGEFTTDAEGRFDLSGVRDADCTLIVWVLAPGYLPMPAVRSAGGPDPVDFGVVRVEHGTSLRLRLELPDGTPAAGAFVTTPFLYTSLPHGFWWYGGLSFSARADSEGRVEFPHAAPRVIYRFDAFTVDRKIKLDDAQVRAPGADDAQEIVLRLAPDLADASLEIRTTDTDGQPIEKGVWVRVEFPGGHETAAWAPYVIEGLPQGRCTVHVSVGNRPTWRGEVVLDRQKRRTIDVKLGGAGRVSGRVVDGQGAPVVGADVGLADEMHTEHVVQFRQTRSDATGAFAFDDLPPGQSYAVLVLADGFVQARVVAPVPTADVVVSLVRLAVVTAKFRSSDGAPLPKHVNIFIDGKSLLAFVEDDRFWFHYLRPGRSNFVVGWPGVLSRKLEVDAEAGATVDLGDVTFEASRTGHGVLTNSTGAPVKFAFVRVAGPQSEARGAMDEAGRFTVEGLDGGPHRVVVWSAREGFCGDVVFPETGEAHVVLSRAGPVRFDVRGDPESVAATRLVVVPEADPATRQRGWSDRDEHTPDYRGVVQARVLPGRWLALLRNEDGTEVGRAAFQVRADQDDELRVAVSVK